MRNDGMAGRFTARALLATVVLATGAARAAQVVVDAPAGSGEFGRVAAVLPNGNLVVTDPLFDGPGTLVDIGAVHLLRPDGVIVATLRGAQAGDQVGSGGVTRLADGDYVVQSPRWQNGSLRDAGAATPCPGDTGIGSIVSPANSLVGTSEGDAVGASVTALTDGSWLATTPGWDDGESLDLGAATFVSNTNGVVGPVTAQNSLVGGTPFDHVGEFARELANGGYVVVSSGWDRGATVDAGAVTFGRAQAGVSGRVSIANSLVGSSAFDRIGGVYPLANGNYVVASTFWDNGAAADAGAATFGSGTTGVAGAISATNSLVGSSSGDRVAESVRALANGNYVVRSPQWRNGAELDAGAATFGSGVTGITGVVSAANSLVGARAGDVVGHSIERLPSGDYVVSSPFWDDGTAPAMGAVTFGPGTTGVAGVVSASNSFVGSRANDSVGVAGVEALANGDYVIRSSEWDNGIATNAGAATLVDAPLGVVGVVSIENSLVGTKSGDRVGRVVTALADGDYVVGSPEWDNGAMVNVGAVTFVRGGQVVGEAVTIANSLVGSTAGDEVGTDVVALPSGDYVVRSPRWDGSVVNAGAVSFGRGDGGTVGVVSPTGSIVGTSANDRVGDRDIVVTACGHYLWDTPGLGRRAASECRGDHARARRRQQQGTHHARQQRHRHHGNERGLVGRPRWGAQSARRRPAGHVSRRAASSRRRDLDQRHGGRPGFFARGCRRDVRRDRRRLADRPGRRARDVPRVERRALRLRHAGGCVGHDRDLLVRHRVRCGRRVHGDRGVHRLDRIRLQRLGARAARGPRRPGVRRRLRVTRAEGPAAGSALHEPGAPSRTAPCPAILGAQFPRNPPCPPPPPTPSRRAPCWAIRSASTSASSPRCGSASPSTA